MNSRLFHIAAPAAALLCAVMLLALPKASAQPLLPEGDNEFGGTPGMHIFLPSNFIRSLHEERLYLARLRNFRAQYRQSLSRGNHERALAYCDTLIRLIESHPKPLIHPAYCYKDRAELLHIMHRDADACIAYERAIKVTDSLRRFEQDDAVREMQASYELDRLALDEALLTANHHKTALIALSLLLAAAVFGVGFIYAANRRTKQLQQKLLLEVQRARESEEKKTAFINTICHEVRTPLNCVAGFSELLCSEEVTPETHGQYCGIIRENRRQLRYIFDDMLEVALLENRSHPLPRQYTDLCNVCRTQLRIAKVRSSRQGVHFAESIPTEEIGLLSNEKYLASLVTELLDNAHKFTEQGFVKLECGRTGSDRVFIAVTDSGCGIPPEQHDYVFERFTKLDTFRPGNGLGLYLCRLIVRHLGGNIRIDASYTGGTRVVAELPRK